jgi:hypothetical protein
VIYLAYQTQADMLFPLRAAVNSFLPMLETGRWEGAGLSVRKVTAACEVIRLAELTHKRRAFGIDAVKVGARHTPHCAADSGRRKRRYLRAWPNLGGT